MCDNNEKSHYTWIKNFNRLLGKGSEMPKEFCPYCMHRYAKRCTNDEQMEEHMDGCFTYEPMKIKLPEEGKNIIQYNDISKQLKLPFCIFAYSECLLTKVDDGKKKTSTKLNKHEISGYGYTVVNPYCPSVCKKHRGKDVGERLLISLLFHFFSSSSLLY